MVTLRSASGDVEVALPCHPESPWGQVGGVVRWPSSIVARSLVVARCEFCAEPVAFQRVYGLEAYSRTSRESNHHRQSVSDTRVTPYQLSHEDT